MGELRSISETLGQGPHQPILRLKVLEFRLNKALQKAKRHHNIRNQDKWHEWVRDRMANQPKALFRLVTRTMPT